LLSWGEKGKLFEGKSDTLVVAN